MLSLYSNILAYEASIALVRDARLRPERPAIARTDRTAPLREAMRVKNFFGLTGIDLGCGKSLDASVITSQGAICYRYDPFFVPLDESETPGAESVDFVLLIYVLNVLPRKERELVADLARSILSPTGFIVLGIREDTDAIGPSWIPFNDGFITPNNTFQAFFPRAEFHRVYALFEGMEARRLARGTYVLYENTWKRD